MLNVAWKGLDRLQRRMKRTPKRVKKEIRGRLKEASREVQQSIRRQFGPRMTDPTTRKRRGGGRQLGTFTGRGKRNIAVRLRVRGRRDFRADIGPRGETLGRWQSGRAFYLRFHELGLAGMPRRSIVERGALAARPRVLRIIGKTVRAFR